MDYMHKSIEELHIPESVTSIGLDFCDPYKLNYIFVDVNNPIYCSKGNCLIDIEEKTYRRIQALVNADFFEHDICGFSMRRTAKGIPLPKGHGRLIDADALDRDLENAQVNLLEEIYGKTFYFYAITDEKFKDLRREFIDKRNSHELPPVGPILEPRHEEIEVEEEAKDEVLESGMALFGEDIIIED